MPRSRLGRLAQKFAREMESLVNGTISVGVKFNYLELDSGVYLVYPGEPVGDKGVEKWTGLMPASIARTSRERDSSPIWLKVRFQLELDAEGRYLTTHSSSFGWCTDPKKTSVYCPIRVEYERDKHSYAASHVQVHGESAGIAHGVGRLDKKRNRDLHRIHFPLGDRRFRPTLEDFIEFLIQEEMVPSKHKDWYSALSVGRKRWEILQTRAAVRRNPAAAIAELKDLGYDSRKRRVSSS